MKPGDKVRLNTQITGMARKHYKPVPKKGWTYLIDEIEAITDEEGTELCLSLKGIENVKDKCGRMHFIQEKYFDFIKDNKTNVNNKQK